MPHGAALPGVSRPASPDPRGGRYRGVANVDESFTDKDFQKLHDGGIRGIRFNFVQHLGGTPDLGEFKRLVSLLQAHPQIGALRSNGRRGFSMTVFPYTVIYRVASGEIVILVIKHDSRRPGYGGKRS